MALDFNNKIPEWKNEGIEPTDELKEKGFTGGYKPPATVFNWFWNKVQKCISELQTVVKAHADNTDNPHSVTKAQVGLSNVDNTADKDKNVLSASKFTNAVKLNGITFDGTKDIEIPATPKRTGLASDADLNEITAQGEYFASYGNTCINKPNNVKGFALKVYWNIVGSTSAITQVLYPSIGAIPMCFIRKGNSNGWADWQEVSTVGHTHTQADIADFNKPTVLVNSDKSSIDLNDITTLGTYISYSPMQYDNCPTTLVTDSKGNPNYSFSLIVLGNRTASTNGTPVYYTQIIIDGFPPTQNSVYIREKYGNAGWTEWYSFYTTKNKIKQADITDFNAPVYLSLQAGEENIDLDNILTPGVYCNVGGVVYKNSPIETDYNGSHLYSFTLLVYKSRVGTNLSGGYITQVYINTWGKSCETFVRNKWGTWGSWSKYYSSGNKPTLEDIVSGSIAVSKGGTGRSSLTEGYALVGNGTNPVNLRYIRNDILQNSSDLVTSGAVYTALSAKADKEKINEFEESLSATDSSVTDLSNTVDNLNKFYYLVGASDSDENLIPYCDITCTGVKDDIIIQTLIDKVPEGSEIKFLSGNYNLSASLKLNKPLSIIGSGLKTVFTSTTKSSSGLGCQSTFSINANGGQTIAGVQLSNLKINGGLCKINGNYVSGDGTKFDIEYPTGYPNSGTATIPMIIVGNIVKLKLDSIQFENKLVSNTRSAVGDWNGNPSVWTIYIRDCFHSNNGTFNGYFIDTGARESSITNFTTLTLALNGCDSTDSLGINLPTKENKEKVLDNSFNVKYYIKGVEE